MNFHPSIQKKDEFIYITIRLHPKSSKENISISEETIEIYIKEPPFKGKANKALIKMLAKRLNLSSSYLEIVGGQTSKIKTIKLKNIQEEKVKLLLFDN